MSTGGERVSRSLGLGPLACGCHMQLVKSCKKEPILYSIEFVAVNEDLMFVNLFPRVSCC